MTIHVINIIKMSDGDKVTLCRLLSSQPDKKIWKRGFHHLDKDKIYLEQWLIQRKSKKHNDTCYEIVGNSAFTHGGFSKIHNCFFNLRLIKNQAEVNTASQKKQRVVKAIKLTQDLCLADIEKEASITQQVTYLHAKELVVEGDECCIVMKKLPVLNLYNFLIKRPTLSFKQRNNLSIALIKAVEEFHALGFIHLDIKPENCLVSQTADDFIIYLIDFGFSAKNTDIITNNAGTPPYAAYECYTSAKKSYKTDIRALGRVLMLVWGEEISYANPAFNFTSLASFAKQPDFSYLFKWLPGLPPFHEELQGLFRQMSLEKMEDRPELSTVLEKLDSFRTQLEPQEITNTQIAVY